MDFEILEEATSPVSTAACSASTISGTEHEDHQTAEKTTLPVPKEAEPTTPSSPSSPTFNKASTLSTNKKLFIALTTIFLNFNVTLGSSLPSGAIESLNTHFHITSPSQIPLPVAIFMAGYILGPLAFSPLSESFGRRPVLLSSFAIYTAFTLGCALAPSWGVFLVFRFLMGCGASAPQTVTGGLFADLWTDLVPRGRAVTVLGLTSNVGPMVGPMVSGFTSSKHWERQFWVALVLAGVNWPMLLAIPETFAPALKAKEAAKLRNGAGVDASADRARTGMQKLRTLVLVVLTRPVRILAEPLVFFTDLFLCYQYVIFFLYFESYPIIFKGTYGMSNGQAALMFIPVAIGAVLAIFVFLWWDAYLAKAKRQRKAWALREEFRRLPLACIGGPLFAISEFWLGWAASPNVHWIVPAMSGVFLGIGIDLTFLALNNYLTDAYDIYSASALASSVLTRNILTTVLLPTVTYPLYDRLGTAWACSLLGFLCLLLTPIPFGFIRWGPKLRERSPFCQKLQRMKEGQPGQEDLENCI